MNSVKLPICFNGCSVFGDYFFQSLYKAWGNQAVSVCAREIDTRK